MPTVHIDGDDSVSPLTLNVEVYDPQLLQNLFVGVRATGAGFEYGSGAATQACWPVKVQGTGPVFIEPIVFLQTAASSSIVVFAQLYQAVDAGAPAAAGDAASVDSGAPPLCPGTPIGSGAVWPGAPTVPPDANVEASEASHGVDGASDAGTGEGHDSGDATLGDGGRDGGAPADAGADAADAARADSGGAG